MTQNRISLWIGVVKFWLSHLIFILIFIFIFILLPTNKKKKSNNSFEYSTARQQNEDKSPIHIVRQK